jgi:hypothetical protein
MHTQFYPLNKNRFVLIIVVFVIITVGSLIGLYYIYTHPNEEGYVYIPNILFALPILGVLGVILGVVNLLSNKKGLTISNDGISFNAGMYKFGPVAYTDIMAVDKKRYMMNDFIVLYLNNPGAFMATKKGISKRMYDENHSTHGSPAVINITQITGDNDAILAEIKSRLLPKN